MGVTGLWKLIEPCGKPVPVETLEGKILAVDISIWLHQVVKGFQDSKGSALNNAHLLGLFNRLCKLLYYRVRPVFVFDGCVPQLKRDTIARRQQQRNKLNTEAERIQSLLLQSLAKEKVVQQALGANSELLLKSTNKRPNTATRAEDDKDDLFRLPELPSTSNANSNKVDNESDINNSSCTSYCSDDHESFTTDESSFDESNPRHSYYNNLQSIDVRSKHFKNLPADVRHEILVDIKETRKQSSWGRLHELPSKSDDFSSFQMKRLLKRRAVQESLEEAETEMGGRSLTLTELQNFFTEEGIVEPSVIEKGSKQISSDENTRILLVRDLKKKLTKVEEKIEKIDEDEPNTIEKDEQIKEENPLKEESIIFEPPTMSTQKSDLKSEKYVNEYDADLELAIALSLEESQVYKEKDYDYESGHVVKLNKDQRNQLKNAAVGPARAYMIEYGGMNDEEVDEIMDKTEAAINPEEDDRFNDLFPESANEIIEKNHVQNSDAITLHVSDEDDTLSDLELPTNTVNNTNSQELNLRVSDDSETDSDLEEVTDTVNDKRTEDVKKMEIVVDLNSPIAPQDDLFADLFEDIQMQSKNLETLKELNQDHELVKQSPTSEYTVTINESEEIINETPTILEEKSIFEMYRSPKKITKIDVKSSVATLTPAKQTDENLLSILDELKKQADEVKIINLKDIKISNPIIELSDEDENNDNALKSFALKEETKNEIIEICDSEDNRNAILSETMKSPNIKTPTKNKTLSEYYKTEYIVKRTPEKKNDESTPPKVKTPFFVNKSPKSNSKNSPTSPANEKLSKSSKSLFSDNTDYVEPITKEIAPVSTEDIIKEAAVALREQKTEEELEKIAENLAQNRRELEHERNRQDRMGMSISQRMNADCQELLRLFGIPYIIAPMEAEAQCAFLDAIELTNGTITDDSDIWLFGGRTVYKNFFAQNKHVLEFRAEHIEKSFNCDRKKLIQLACLVGSDYTPGIHGIGAVTALEILASFAIGPKEGTAQQLQETNTHILMSTILSSLSKFRDWWLSHKASALPPGSSSRMSLLKKLKNIELHDGFPSMAVVEAYLTPKVDESKEALTWGYPDVESIREFTKRSFGWTLSKTDDILTPVLKKLNEKKTQATIKNYFSIKSVHAENQLKVSKRVQNAIERMSGIVDEETPTKPAKNIRAKRKNAKPIGEVSEETESATTSTKRVRRAKRATTTTTEQAELTNTNEMENLSNDPSVSTSEHNTCDTSSLSTILLKKTPRIPSTQQIIPQREKDKAQMIKNKEKAAKVFKNDPIPTKKKRKS